jgi:hypothetical protein
VTNPSLGTGKYAGLVSIEHGAIVYHEIDPLATVAIVITYPIPISQLSPSQVFSEKSFPIRVLTFSEAGKSFELQFSIDGQTAQPLPFVRALSGGARFHSFDVREISSGKHHLRVLSDTKTEEIDFFVGESSPVVSESRSFMTPYFFVAVVPILAILAALKVIPWWRFAADQIDRYSNFLNRGIGDIKWYQQLYLGPLYMWSRCRNVPVMFSVMFVIGLVWWLPIPFWFAMVESKLSVMFAWGVVTNGNWFGFNTPLWFTTCYLLMVLIPFINLISNFYERRSLSTAQRVENVLLIIPITFMLLAWLACLLVASGALSVFTSPPLYGLIVAAALSGRRIWVDRRKTMQTGAEEEPALGDDSKKQLQSGSGEEDGMSEP